eukprot:364974-Alexandrium_andersonii.AAC.1
MALCGLADFVMYSTAPFPSRPRRRGLPDEQLPRYMPVVFVLVAQPVFVHAKEPGKLRDTRRDLHVLGWQTFGDRPRLSQFQNAECL